MIVFSITTHFTTPFSPTGLMEENVEFLTFSRRHQVLRARKYPWTHFPTLPVTHPYISPHPIPKYHNLNLCFPVFYQCNYMTLVLKHLIVHIIESSRNRQRLFQSHCTLFRYWFNCKLKIKAHEKERRLKIFK